jgi:SH3 domain-containing YSC84-like protein 1
MKKIALSATFSLLALVWVGCASHNDTTRVNAAGKPVNETRAEVLNRMNDAGKILSNITSGPDQQVPNTVLADAKCVAIVPDMVKGGFVVGAEHGRGVATCRTANGSWSAPAFFTLTGGSWGAQIGVESVDLVMMVMNQKGMDQLLSANWRFGGQGSVAAGPVGREAGASTDWKLRAQVLTYSRSKGVFAGLTLNGANIQQDDDSTRAFYGKDYTFRSLLAGNVTPPTQARSFLASVRTNFREANASK